MAQHRKYFTGVATGLVAALSVGIAGCTPTYEGYGQAPGPSGSANGAAPSYAPPGYAPPQGYAATPYGRAPGPAPVQMLDWRQTVRLENSDREARFRRLAAQGLIQSPQFYEEFISGRDLPPEFGVDIPVLRVVFPERVFFDTAQSAVRPDAEPIIDLIARTLGADVPDVSVFVAGHTDSRGGDVYNYGLSVDRANAVAKDLASRGVGSTYHLWSIGFGKAVPLVPNTTAENMALNRRVEILIAARPQAIAVWLSRQAVAACGNVPPALRASCQQEVAALPPIEAHPVLKPQEQVPVSLPPSSASATIGGSPTAVRMSPGGEPAHIAPSSGAEVSAPAPAQVVQSGPSAKTDVTLDPTATYVIHLDDQHVEVHGVPHT